jgi:uncharacterized protein
MIRRYLILILFGLHTLSGCSLAPTMQSPEMIQAETLLQNGQNKEAAVIYKQLAEVNSGEQNQYRLLAADALIRANDIKQAKYYLSLLEGHSLNPAQLNHLNLLQTQIELSHGKAEKALSQLKAIDVSLLNNQTKIAYYQSLAFAYSLTGDSLQSAQALINTDPLLMNQKMRGKNYAQILSTLSLLSEQDLHLKQPLSATTLNGWMSLARVFKLDDANLNDNLLKWRKLYPVHPANSAFLTDYLKNYQHRFEHLAMIAVFLPESGSYAAPAAVIKKGFIKAYQLAKKNNATTSEIRFYDTQKSSPVDLYQQAIKEGAQLVVGPLDKKEIKELASSTKLTIPVLALNHVEGLNSPKLYQFALSPIDDAGQIVAKARHDGHQNALFLVPKSEQGKRFAHYFSNNWQSSGGNKVNLEAYDDTKNDFSQLSEQVLAKNELENPIDAVILNAYAIPARSLYRVLQKNTVTAKLPVYATSQIYLGDDDEARDRKLDGVVFCDAPWVFNQAYEGELSKYALHSSWQNLSPSYLRLLPMGIDAYNLIGHLNEMKNKPYSGATGRLQLDADNRIMRELFCAKFSNGVPKTLNFASENPVAEPEPVSKPLDSGTVAPEKNQSTLPKLPELGDVINSIPNSGK